MGLERKNRVKEETITTGTGDLILNGTAPAGYRIFADAITNLATVRYFIESEDLTEWEVGEGIFTDGTPDTLSRDTIYASSNADALVNFSAGIKEVAVSLVAEDILGGQNSIIRNETPSGDLDGTDVTYTLADSPITDSLALYLNGQRLTYTEDYTLSGNTITFVTAPISGDIIRADYLLAGEGSGNADTLDGLHAIDIMSALNPIGSIYSNYEDSTNPGTLLGFGTWVAIEGEVVVGYKSGDADFGTPSGAVGAKTHTLTASESGLPAHGHSLSEQVIWRGTVGTGANETVVDGDRDFGAASVLDNSAANASSAHNNIQPSRICYVWRRTA
jgi:hypothetical protein